MADIKNSPGPLNPQQEPQMQWRLMLAFLLMGAVLFLTPRFYKAVMPEQAKPAQTATEQAQPTATPEAAAEPAAAPQAKPTKAAAPVAAAAPETFIVDTNVYRVVLSNQGGVVRSWVLKKYKDSLGEPLELVNTDEKATQTTGYPFSLAFPKAKPSIDVNAVLYAAKPSPDGLGIDYDYSDGSVAVHKSFRFEQASYLSQVSSEVTQGGKGVENLLAWRGGIGDAAVHAHVDQGLTLFYDLAAGKLVTKAAKAAKDGPVTDYGTYSFAGVEDRYFTAVFLPRGETSFAIRTVSDNVPYQVDKIEPQPHVGAEVGGQARNEFTLFAGPKDLDLMRKVDPRLEQTVDFGRWFGWLAKPLFLAVNWINDHMTHNFGWAIVVITILINMVLLPLRLTSMKSMKKMQALKPHVDVINAKYKNVGLRDPKKQEQNQEVMELYKKHGVNPMGGCLPMVLQMPIFIAFYTVLQVAIEMRGASWLWVTDLSQPEHLFQIGGTPIRILPIAMIVAQWVMQKMTPMPVADPSQQSQQKMMQFMPLIFGFMFYGMSSGLVLYWLTSNLVGIAQQYFINKSMPLPAEASGPPSPAAKSKKPSGGKR
jgi:YidC/Oxa1 family membrane protein insertase